METRLRAVSLGARLEGMLLSATNHANGTLTVDFSGDSSNAVYWEVNMTGLLEKGIPATATSNFTFLCPQTGEYIGGRFYFGGDMPFFIDRGGTRGFDDVSSTDKVSTNNLLGGNSSWSMSGVLDRLILEVFLEGGAQSATTTFFTTLPVSLLVLGTWSLPEGVRVDLRVSALKSAWKGMANLEDGLVYGNQSTMAKKP